MAYIPKDAGRHPKVPEKIRNCPKAYKDLTEGPHYTLPMLRLLDEFPALSLGLLDETFLTDILGAMTGQIKKEGSFAEYGDCLDVIDPKKIPASQADSSDMPQKTAGG